MTAYGSGVYGEGYYGDPPTPSAGSSAVNVLMENVGFEAVAPIRDATFEIDENVGYTPPASIVIQQPQIGWGYPMRQEGSGLILVGDANPTVSMFEDVRVSPSETLDSLILGTSPEAYYRGAETSGTTTVDSSPNNRSGVPGYITGYTLGAAGLDSSAPGDTCVDYDPATANVQVPVAPWMDFAHDITIFALIRPDTIGVNQTIVARDNNGSHGPWHLRLLSDNRVQFTIWAAAFAPHNMISTNALVAARYSVAASYAGATGAWKIYINGVPNGSGTETLNLGLADAFQRLSIGCYNAAGGPFDGRIGKVALWSQTLSDQTHLEFAQAAGTA
jgi:hypothetical protein